MATAVAKIKGITMITPKGEPFAFINISQLGHKSELITDFLLSKYGLPTVPGSYSNSSEHIRLSFGAPPEILNEAVCRLSMAVDELQNMSTDDVIKSLSSVGT